MNSTFSLSGFVSPGREYAPIYSWVWNSPLSKEETGKQIDEMKRLGIKAFYIIPEPKAFRPNTMVTELEPDYLTPGYFEHFRYAAEYGASLGMRVWLYDEGGWPSGGACGKVLEQSPETAKRMLAGDEFTLPRGEAYRRRRPDAAAAFAGGVMIAEGDSFPADTAVTEYYSRQENNGGSDYPDLTLRESTDRFINITHEGYAEAMGDLMGSVFSAVFTDEPKAPRSVPFREEIVKAYGEKYGESVLPYLPELAGDRVPDEKGIEVRRRWYDLCSRFFCENFLMPCKEWSNRHGMAFTGHMDKDDDPDGCVSGCNYHIMRALRCLDIPGVDAIWRQIFPAEPSNLRRGDPICQNRFYPRYASSAMRQTKGSFSLTESFGVYGSGITCGQMRYVLGFQAIRGINVFNMMIVSYSREGYHLAGEQPGFSEKLTGFERLPEFNSYLERLSFLTSLGRRVCRTALYYPVGDYWGGVNRSLMSERFEAAGEEMERRQVDFDIFDDDVLLGAEGLDSGEIRYGDACYTEIVIPEGAYIPPESMAALDRFEAGGGKICRSAKEPTPAVKTAGDAPGLTASAHELDGGCLTLLFNQALTLKTYNVPLPGSRYVYIVSPEDGKLYLPDVSDGVVRVAMESGQTLGLLESETPMPAEELPDIGGAEGYAAHDLTVRRLKGFDFIDDRPETLTYDDVPVPCETGDWKEITGEDFSGSCEYTAKITLPGVTGGAVLDLGEVRYIADVSVNGASVGTRLFPPYRFKVPSSALKEGENILTVKVTNTPANRFHFTKMFDKYEPRQVTGYHEVSKEFYPDTLASGLFGPVKMYVKR